MDFAAHPIDPEIEFIVGLPSFKHFLPTNHLFSFLPIVVLALVFNVRTSTTNLDTN